jgi:hypothetical protein
MLTMTTAAADLSGHWICEAKTHAGLLGGSLFREENHKLLITFEVYNHILNRRSFDSGTDRGTWVGIRELNYISTRRFAMLRRLWSLKVYAAVP